MYMNFQCGMENTKDRGIVYARKNPQQTSQNSFSAKKKKKSLFCPNL